MTTPDHQPDRPDEAFLAEVDAFLGALPEDSARVQRIGRNLPANFHEVLEQKARRLEADPRVVGLRLNWALLSGTLAVAAGLVGMLVVVWLLKDAGRQSPELRAVERGNERVGEDEVEVVITIAPDKDPAPARLGPRPRDPQPAAAAVAQQKIVTPQPAPGVVEGLVADGQEVAGLPGLPARPWSFSRIVAADPPEVREAAWPRTDIDRFALAAMERAGVSPVGDADRAALIRRLSYDLTGLPPSPELVERFLHNPSPAAYGSVVDELMAKWQFGEHWARHWLDVAGYDASLPNAWRYREYVIAAFNRDKGFDRFLAEQLAGDLLPVNSLDERAEGRIATGFLALGHYDAAETDAETLVMDQAGRQVELVSRAFMALSVSCSRCHDHPHDPIPQRDFYALAGIFRSTEIYNGFRPAADGHPRGEGLLPLQLEPQTRAAAKVIDGQQREAELKRLRSLVASSAKRLARAKDRGGDEDRVARLERESMQLRRQLRQMESIDVSRLKELGFTSIGVAEQKRPGDCPLNVRGDVHQRGEPVPRGFLSALAEAVPAAPIPAGSSGRLELAEWLTDSRHPLTSRVYVNRVWHHLFGRGLVASSDDFGALGGRPSHPELLDFLARRFVDGGWSNKQLVREIVLSRTYQLAATTGANNLAIDPDNRLLWRHVPRQLSGEEVRDSMVAIAGLLAEDPGTGGGTKRYFAAGEYGGGSAIHDASEFPLSSSFRTIYLPIADNHHQGSELPTDCPELKARPDVRGAVLARAAPPISDEFIYQVSMGAAFPLVDRRDRRPLATKVAGVFLAALGRKPNYDEAQRAQQSISEFKPGLEIAPGRPRRPITASAPGPAAMLDQLVPSIVLQARAAQSNLDSMALATPWIRLYHELLQSPEFRSLR